MTRQERLAALRERHRQAVEARLDAELAREKRDTRRLLPKDLYSERLRTELMDALLGKSHGFQDDPSRLPSESEAQISVAHVVHDVADRKKYRGKLFVARSKVPPHSPLRAGGKASRSAIYLFTSPDAVVPKGYVPVPRELRGPSIADYINKRIGGTEVKRVEGEPRHEPERCDRCGQDGAMSLYEGDRLCESCLRTVKGIEATIRAATEQPEREESSVPVSVAVELEVLNHYTKLFSTAADIMSEALLGIRQSIERVGQK